MAPQSGTQDPDVKDQPALNPSYEILRRLREQPYCFRFFQAVRLMERLRPDAAPVGDFADPAREAVRFGSHPSLAFPASDIQSIAWDEDPPRMAVNFMGLVGPNGLLPRVYTEFIENRVRARDRSARDFLDLFHHRAISLFYRAWRKYRLPDHYGRGDDDRFSPYLLSLVGLAPQHLQRRQTVDDDSLVYYAGLLALQPRSAVALENILADYFRVAVEVEQFVGAWCTLEAESLCAFEEEESVSQMLGGGAVVGDQVWVQQSVVRVRLGPLTLAQYDEFLPGRAGHRRLRALTRFFAGDQIEFHVELALRRDQVPDARLDEDETLQLGWTTWVKTRPEFPRDPRDTVLVLSGGPH